MEATDILRSFVTNALLVGLLFTLARPKCRRRTFWAVYCGIVLLDLALNIYFYMRNDYTTLGKLDILFFILIGAAAKPLFRETWMQWLFNCLTVMNVYAITVIVSYYLCGLFPYPAYAVIVLRFLIFAGFILLFLKKLRPLYRQATERWSVYLFVAIGLFANFGWYFMSSADVKQTLTANAGPLLLLVLVTVLVYFAIFASLKKTLREALLKEENMKMQWDKELTKQRLSLMDETVRQMSIAQHDRRHFNNTLLSLLERGEGDRAAEMIKRQSEALPKKPQSYCENVSVNAAVSYYAELARQRGVQCDLRLDVPEKLEVDELSLAMAVSNLMENAVNAAAALPDKRGTLRFTAVAAGQLIFEMSNPCGPMAALDRQGLPVPHEAGHGNGTRSIVAFVKACGGELAYEIKNGIFKVRMMV
jgi:hypothetical protein